MAIQQTRGVLCKVSARGELEILRQARLDAQRIVNRLGLLYGKVDVEGPERRAFVHAYAVKEALTTLIGETTAAVDDEAATDDLFARAARREGDGDRRWRWESE